MILRTMALLLTLLVANISSEAAQRQVTVFSDGSLVEIEAVAQKGIAEVPLPGQIRNGSLRVKPLDNTSIEEVKLMPFQLPDKLQRDMDALTEQKARLEDRLKALDTKEGIFEAAAKSQSSKAPRKTKTNPDPLASVRQGTDFAIAQLEAVFTARRRTEQELKRINTRIDHLTKRAVEGPTARITVSPSSGKIKIAAVLTDNGWRPRYELRLSRTDNARLVQLAEVTALPTGFTVRMAPVPLSGSQPQHTVPAAPGRATRLAEWQLPVSRQEVVVGPLSSFSITLQNHTGLSLPSGEVTVYSQGEFLGTAPLPAAAPNAPLTISNRAQQ